MHVILCEAFLVDHLTDTMVSRSLKFFNVTRHGENGDHFIPK